MVVTPNGYKEGTLYSVIPNNGNGDFTVTRATTATRVNSAGLVELVPYNLLQYSEDFGNAYWAKTNATITTNTTTAPNFTLTADTITDNATNGQHKVQTAALSDLASGASFVASAYIKANTATRVCLYVYGTSLGVGVDLLTGNQITVSGLTNASPGNVTINNVGNGWYYIELRSTVAGAFSIAIMMVSGTDFSYAGSGNSLYYWGAQLTEGTSALPYQKTETRLNIPRLDYSNGSCPSLLVEPQRTNLALYSEQFDNAAWTKSETTVSANSTISPSGLSNADTLTANGTSNVHQILLTGLFTLNSGTTYTTSIYAKAGTNNFIQIVGTALVYTSSTYANYDLVNGVVGSVASGVTASIVSVGDGWYRCSMTATAISTSSSNSFIVVIINNANSPRGEVNTLTTSVYLWGAQLEAGAYPTSYIPTTTASVTRNADVISKTGISSLIGQTEGTFVFKANVVQPIGLGVQSLLKASNDSESQLFIISYVANDGKVAFDFYIGSSYSFTLTSTSPISKGINNIGIVYKAGAYKLYINGSQVASSTNSSPITNTISKLSIGSGVAPMYYDFLNVWKTALTDDQLEALTGTSFNTYAEMASYYNYTLQ